MAANGAMGKDVWMLDFAETTTNQCKAVAQDGGFMVQCDHGASHCGPPADLQAAQWKFLKDHPFGVDPELYAAALPAGTPSYCKICK